MATRRVRRETIINSGHRRATSDPLRKPGWQVRQSVAEAVKEAVEEGAAESQNAFIERALIRELKEIRRQRACDAYARAAADPAFVEDMRKIAQAFEVTTCDGLVRCEALDSLKER